MYNIELQNKILDIFKEYKKICEENNLRYYAIGGTCIGTIRHKGFIPWDDDIDVAMPIDDYEKFRRIAKTELHGKYRLIDYEEDNNRTSNFLKMQDITTTFVEEKEIKRLNRYKGVFIDIMPITAINKNSIKARQLKLRFFINAKLNENIKIPYKCKTKLKGKIFWILSHVLFILKNKDHYSKKFDKLCKKYKISEENDILFPWRIPLRKPYSNVFNYNDFKETCEMPFEDTTIAVPIGYDNYLKKDFGDYMKLPPESKRVCHNPAILDLEKSYLTYIEEARKDKNE